MFVYKLYKACQAKCKIELNIVFNITIWDYSQRNLPCSLATKKTKKRSRMSSNIYSREICLCGDIECVKFIIWCLNCFECYYNYAIFPNFPLEEVR